MRLFYRYNVIKVQNAEPVEPATPSVLAPIDANKLQQLKACKQEEQQIADQEKPANLSVQKCEFKLNDSKCENIENGNYSNLLNEIRNVIAFNSTNFRG